MVAFFGDAPELQAAYFKSVGGAPVDGLALEYENTMPLADQTFAAGVVTSDQLRALRTLEELLDRMRGQINEVFWTPTALRNDLVWREVRDAAKTALELF